MLAFRFPRLFPVTVTNPETFAAWILLRVLPWTSAEDTSPNERLLAFTLLRVLPWTSAEDTIPKARLLAFRLLSVFE